MDPRLKQFVRDVLAGELRLKVPRENVVKMLNGSTEVVLHRDGQFQVELITVRRGSTIPRHVHQCVDSYELLLAAGADAQMRNGARVYSGKDRPPLVVRIRRGMPHGGAPGSEDAAFLSVQLWRDVRPTFITDDWVGEEWK